MRPSGHTDPGVAAAAASELSIRRAFESICGHPSHQLLFSALPLNMMENDSAGGWQLLKGGGGEEERIAGVKQRAQKPVAFILDNKSLSLSGGEDCG